MSRRWRHDPIWIVALDPRDELAFVGFSFDEGTKFDRVLPNIEPQVSLPMLRVRTVAGEAIVGQDRANIAVESNGLYRFEARKPQAAERTVKRYAKLRPKRCI